MKTKKGSILDVVFLTVFLTLVAIGIVIMYHMTAVFDTVVDAQVAAGNFPADAATMSEASMSAVGDFNVIFVFIYVAINLATVVSAFLARTHPIMFLVFFIVQVVAVYMSGQMADLYNTIAADPTLSTDFTLFSWIGVIFTNYGVLTLLFSIMVALAMMAIPV